MTRTDGTAGVFRIPFAFGLASAADAAWLRLPYTPLTPTIIGVDDPKSRYYNQVVDNTKVQRDWDSNEAMMRHDGLYRWGAFIAHNPHGTPGLGSCIFLHLWPGPGKSTAGCTGMSEADLKTVLAWLDPAKEPRIVQGLETW
jgi:L,D-peptidoglycan transpeptidase YkuD (ErfK/YbiS/YcfS/YnhG family)